MATYQDLVANRLPLESFRAAAPKKALGKGEHACPQLPLHLFEWSEGDQQGSEKSGLMSTEKIQSGNRAAVRIIFAPQDTPATQISDGLCDLFDRCKIPSAFIEESLQSISQSFAVRKHIDGSTYVWFHFLCKDITILDGRVVHNPGASNSNLGRSSNNSQAQFLSQANFTWLKPGFVLRIEGSRSSPPAPSRSSTSGSDNTLTSTATQSKVELFCFGAPVTLRDRVEILKNNVSCEDLVHDPYIMLEIVMNEMYKIMDRTVWRISDVFGEIETKTLAMASTPGRATKTSLDFAGLHNLCKHSIYLRENCESALATLNDLRDHHKVVIGDKPSPLQESTKQAFKYQKTLFQSTQRRLASLDARMANIIELSFHIVTQGDSRLMQSESQSMKTIAVMTLLFMPLSTVATIFGTQFMKLQEDEPYHITVSRDFWMLWIIAVPLTVIVMTCWRVWYADAKMRLVDEIPRDAERYMGWKTLRQTMRSTKKDEGQAVSVVSRGLDAKV